MAGISPVFTPPHQKCGFRYRYTGSATTLKRGLCVHTASYTHAMGGLFRSTLSICTIHLASLLRSTEMHIPSTDKLQVFLVNDGVHLREDVICGLNALGLEVSGFGDAAGLYRALAVQHCDIVLIDMDLPGEAGFAIAEHLSANPAMGLVFVSEQVALDDRLRGLSLGVDAYMVKPVDVRLLAATLQALQRRLRRKKPDAWVSAPRAARAAKVLPKWKLSSDDWTLRSPQGGELMVSETERFFLKIMLKAGGEIVVRSKLVAAFTDDDEHYDPHRLDSVICRLRKRTEQAGLGPLPLLSIRGTGYVFSA